MIANKQLALEALKLLMAPHDKKMANFEIYSSNDKNRSIRALVIYKDAFNSLNSKTNQSVKDQYNEVKNNI